MATLLMADLHPTGGPKIWSGNEISSSIMSRIPIQTDPEGCPVKNQPFPQPMFILQKLTPLWDHGIHNWKHILGRTPGVRPYFFDEREFKWANPTMSFPLSQALSHALHYLRVMLSSRDAASWRRLKSIIPTLRDNDLTIAPRLRHILDPDWGNLPNRPCPLVVARATRQPTIGEAFRRAPTPPLQSNGEAAPHIVIHFKPRGKKRGLQTRTRQQKKNSTNDRPHSGKRRPWRLRINLTVPSPLIA